MELKNALSGTFLRFFISKHDLSFINGSAEETCYDLHYFVNFQDDLHVLIAACLHYFDKIVQKEE